MFEVFKGDLINRKMGEGLDEGEGGGAGEGRLLLGQLEQLMAG